MTIGSSRIGRRHEVARPRQVVGARHQLPGAAEDALLLSLEDGRVEVEAGRQGRCASEGMWCGAHSGSVPASTPDLDFPPAAA